MMESKQVLYTEQPADGIRFLAENIVKMGADKLFHYVLLYDILFMDTGTQRKYVSIS